MTNTTKKIIYQQNPGPADQDYSPVSFSRTITDQSVLVNAANKVRKHQLCIDVLRPCVENLFVMNKTIVHRLLQISCKRSCSYKSVRRPDVGKSRKLTAPNLSEPNPQVKHDLTKQIKAKILASGPITVADYMREVLTNPLAGYYMNRDVFGREGDFVTSPEISQIFGELVAIWVLMEWQKLGSPSPFQFVELGPGRGTLARDILRVLTQFKLGGQFSMHMVEISPHLSRVQAQRFCLEHHLVDDNVSPYYQVGETATGTKAYWYKRLEDVPQEFSVILAHEFFDALPVHKLQLDNGVWKEILIDINESESADETPFRFVISNGQTPISQLYKPIEGDSRQCLEYSLETDRLVSHLIERLQRDGGISLIMDYGHFGEKTDTFRAFKKHELYDPLKQPGCADLTADVDFRQIKRVAEADGKVICFGPVEQGTFLKRMEGDARLEQLLMHALPENQESIKTGYEMLTSSTQMGQRFKFLSMFPAVVKEHLIKFPVQGFS